MSSRRWILTADWHLSDGAFARHPTMSGDALYSLEQIVGYCERNDVEALLAAGDLVDTLNPSPPVQKRTHECLRRLVRKTRFLYVQGQHEMFRGCPRLSVEEFGTWMHNREESIGGITVYGLDWMPANELAKVLPTIDIDVLMCHQRWSDWSFHNSEASLSDVGFAKIILTGDTHIARHQLIKLKSGGFANAFSPGSICLQSIDEPAEKSFYVVELDDHGNPTKLETVQLMTRPFRRLKIYKREELHTLEKSVADLLAASDEQLRKGMPAEIAKPYLSVEYSSDLKGVPDVVNGLSDRMHVHLDPRHPQTVNLVVRTDSIRTVDHSALLSAMLVDAPIPQWIVDNFLKTPQEQWELAYEGLRDQFIANQQ